ncbi:FAST kinase domain-containing protein 5, mitochondrial isoform X2 [Corythoichthys intestinalis]|nr:FAST kinase domain-containing protein 5, mitochondrial isoform X2 [Corythoichthys intestinalis]XP_057708739.1 FAST kinase domain-containing protein 5, mitochondrial isoform X2 [Corythoichthys intestinalis]XP_057708740.1 FAST kinase domain-containing protein 5, mitochondrial isoform X2 [Corythoichthys intestinalis]XP_057708741.1 FAST kinase domain-containing protein 5, mitochondrial isoform X2 [Corythoichthys intestinalis]XP_061799481.1 FAST kinase domain-containing protein 5, mitochondrial-l
MATCVLCRSSPRLRYLPGLKKGFAQCVLGKLDIELDEQDKTVDVLRHLDASIHGCYRLHYSPSLYYHPERKSFLSQSQGDLSDEEPCLTTVAPSFWQQSNRYSVSSSRHLSSSKNTLLDLAFNKSSESKTPEVPHQRISTLPDVRVDTRAFLKCRPSYSSFSLDLTQRPPPIKWEQVVQLLQKVTILKGSVKPSELSNLFVGLSHIDSDKVLLVKTDQRFIMLLRYSVENLCHFSLFELLDVLKSFVWLEMPHSHTVLRLYEAELSHRANEMTLEQLLLAADLWRCIGRKVPQFLKRLFDFVSLYHGQVGLAELVQLLYIMGEGRQCPKVLIQPIEQLLMRHLQQLQPEEVGTVCLGLFKSQTSLSEMAVNRLVDKAHSVVVCMSDFAMVNVLKYLRFSYMSHKSWMEAMTCEVPQRAHRMGIKGLMHVALACSALHYKNDRILVAIAEKIPSLVPHCRSKDSCKLLWAFGTLGFLPSRNQSFYLSLTEALRQRKAEFNRYPEHLLTGLLGLAFVSQFPEDLIELALSPDFVSLALKSTQLELKKDLFTLDGVVALELPQWTGSRLSGELKEEVKEMLWDFVQSDVCQKLEVKEAEAALQQLLGGDKFVCKRMILPHMRSIDLEVHLDASGQPLPVNPESQTTIKSSSSKIASKQALGTMNLGVSVTDDLIAQLKNAKSHPVPKSSPSAVPSPSLVEPDAGEILFNHGLKLTTAITEILTAPSSQRSVHCDNIVKIAIQLPGRNHYCQQSQQLLGLHAMKRRQLRLAGYKVVELPYQEWIPMLKKSRTEKLAYLHCKVYNSLEDQNE